MATSAADRKKQERARKRKKGLVPREVWVHESRVEDLKKIETRLQKEKKT